MIEDFYNSTALVEREIRLASARKVGSVATTWTTRIESLPCRLAKRSITETDEKGKMTIRQVQRLYCSVSSTNKTIVESDRATVNDRVYQITGIYNPGAQDRHLEINLLEIR